MSKLLKTIWGHTFVPVFFTLCFLLVLAFTRFLNPDYSFLPTALGILFISTMFGICLVVLFKKKISVLNPCSLQKYAYGVVIAFLLNLTFIVLGPAIIDRSLTIFLLSSLDNQSISMSSDNLQMTAEDNWWDAGRQIDYRLKEELILGNIFQVPSGQYCISDSGKVYLKLARFMSKIFSLDHGLTSLSVKSRVIGDCLS
jgi:hypothetical protein